jgi:YegS/Rv2252/BmrU family lipid kinase
MIIGRTGSISTYKQVSLIYNPYAGGLRGVRMGRLDRAHVTLNKKLGPVKRYQTDGPNTAGAIAKRCIEEGSDLIIAAGGDGTINEVVEGMAGSPVPLGILPGGTANVLANEIGLTGGLERAAEKILNCEKRRVPIGRLALNGGSIGRNFLLMAGVGLDAHIVLHVDPVLKARFGKLAYWAAGMPEFLRKLEVFQVEVDGVKHLCSFALISKVRNYGGDFEIAQQVRVDHDEFEVVLFEGANPWRYVIYLTGVALKQAARLPGVRVMRARDVKMLPVNGDSVHLQVDGEYAGQLPARVSVVPDALTLLVPGGYGRN